ncbi:MAG: hypothetical protein EON54_08945 [Alcaligenaceae bacterium]|nr:MAG: hypothetical protein EON54_08945 [Alcaligenaceae bacterium]
MKSETTSDNWSRREPAFELAAIQVLRSMKHPLSIREITDVIIEKRLAKVRGKTPEKTLYSIITRGEQTRAIRGETPIFIRVQNGRTVKYSLKAK